MTRECRRHIVRGHSGSVVADADQPTAAVLESDLDERRAGVDGVLHQLLHHRGRTLDNLARGDLIGHGAGKN